MSFESFEAKVRKIAKNAGVPVFVKHDPETGQHFARCGDITISGNTTSLKVQVRWGSGHVAHSDLEV